MQFEFAYRKIPKISAGAYIFQRPFLRGLFLEGLIFGGAYLRREICISKLIGLALQLEVNLLFLLCFTLYLRAIFQVQAPRGLILLEGRFNGGFLRYRFGGLTFGGAYFWNFTVFAGHQLGLVPRTQGHTILSHLRHANFCIYH